MSGTFHTLEWVRVFADSVLLLLGVVPIFLAALRSLAERDAPREPDAATVQQAVQVILRETSGCRGSRRWRS